MTAVGTANAPRSVRDAANCRLGCRTRLMTRSCSSLARLLEARPEPDGGNARAESRTGAVIQRALGASLHFWALEVTATGAIQQCALRSNSAHAPAVRPL